MHDRRIGDAERPIDPRRRNGNLAAFRRPVIGERSEGLPRGCGHLRIGVEPK